ncbi:MAG: ATPase, partial [Clostridia bacterium]|nr:ATPase [Clostridia bacterium]
ILLSLGNTPIIIDEPESNLGEPVIYNELVKILKIIKSKRQIIFATHNANIVINGDSDQVIHLDKDSNITSFTIENMEQRAKLYALEGGFEAFLNREKRYKQE